MMMMKGHPSPWGAIDSVEEVAPGIEFVSTASHGGFYVAPDKLALIPAAWKAATINKQGFSGWFEEDCDWCMVALTFPDAFKSYPPGVVKATFDYFFAKKIKESA